MEPTKHQLFKIADGTSAIVFVPTLHKVYRVAQDIAETLPNFVTAPTTAVRQESEKEHRYLFAEATLLLTNQCKLGCIYCFGEFVPRPKETIIMPTEIVHAAIDYLTECTIKSGKQRIVARMFGGEPTLPWDTLVEAVQYLRLQASKNGLASSATITTNGCVVPQRARWLAEHMDRILLSMDGPEDIHNAQRGGSFNRVFGTAKKIYQIAPQKLRFRATVSAASVQRLPEMVRFFGENFPGCVQLYEPLFAMGRAKANPLAQPPEASQFFEKLLEAAEIAKKYNTRVRTSLTGAWRTAGTAFCGVAGQNFMVNYDGRVLACHRMAESDVNEAAPLFCYGRFNPLEKKFVFDDERYRRLQQLTVTSIPGCENCFARYGCKGDCPANKATVSPRSFWREKSYRCKEIREFTKNLLRYALDHRGEQGLIF